MTREEQIKAIYEKIADKTLSFGCKVKRRFWDYFSENKIVKPDIYNKWRFKVDWWADSFPMWIVDLWVWLIQTRFSNDEFIIWHPVMIWDVLDYWENLEENKNYWWYYQYEVIKDIIEFWKEKRKPIEEQSDDTIEFIFNLIK